MDVSLNGGTPKSSILIGFSIYTIHFWGTPILGNPHIISGQIIYSNFYWREPVLNPQDFHLEPVWPGRAQAENHRKWFLNTRPLSRPAQSPKVAKVWIFGFWTFLRMEKRRYNQKSTDVYAWLGWLPPGVEKWRQKAVVSSGGRRLRSEHLQIFGIFGEHLDGYDSWFLLGSGTHSLIA